MARRPLLLSGVLKSQERPGRRRPLASPRAPAGVPAYRIPVPPSPPCRTAPRRDPSTCARTLAASRRRRRAERQTSRARAEGAGRGRKAAPVPGSRGGGNGENTSHKSYRPLCVLTFKRAGDRSWESG
ncbi:hypothetical protein R6Z07F_005103 [Ovis aries]